MILDQKNQDVQDISMFLVNRQVKGGQYRRAKVGHFVRG